MKYRIILPLITIFLSLNLTARQAKPGARTFTQPDGSTFTALVRGDEFTKIQTTIEGYSIKQGEDGWWYYAMYDENGLKSCTDYKVGQPAPQTILNSSMQIPYEALRKNAVKRRSLPDGVSRARAVSKANSSDLSTKHGIIILAQFKDKKFQHSREDFVKMITQEGYSKNGATGCVIDYFNAQFGGALDFKFDISPIVTLNKNLSYYGQNDGDGMDINPHVMIYEACQLADSSVDFSKYDEDGDGTIDNVFVFYAGGDEAETAEDNLIWSHSWQLATYGDIYKYVDGVLIDNYACTSELTRVYESEYSDEYEDILCGIGTFCHEYSHTLGLPDLYDTDYAQSGGYAAGLWYSTALMDAGNTNNIGNTPPYLNAIEREYLAELGYPGMKKPQIIDKAGFYTLEPIGKSGEYYRINSNVQGDYYLLENRSEEGWDEYIGGSGMLVYHIDKSTRNTGYSDSYERNFTAEDRWEYNEINARSNHQCADLIEADKRTDTFNSMENSTYINYLYNLTGLFFPYKNTTSIDNLTFWGSASSNLKISSIQKSGKNITFYVSDGNSSTSVPEVSNIEIEKFQDAVILNFRSTAPFSGNAVVSWGRTGETSTQTVKAKAYDTGMYAFVIEGLKPASSYTFKIRFELNGVEGKISEESVMTSKKTSEYPYIYLKNTRRNDDNTFPSGSKVPLRLYNAFDAAEITWKFNGKKIAVEADGKYTLTESGDLTAHIINTDGSEDIIKKEILVTNE